jgi:hypothetical protein
MMYARAQGIIPLCNNIETFCYENAVIDRSKHGYDGPVHVSDGGFTCETANVFMETVKSMGMEEVADLQDFSQVGGFSVRIARHLRMKSRKQMPNVFLAMAKIRQQEWQSTRRSLLLPLPASSGWTAPEFIHPARGNCGSSHL